MFVEIRGYARSRHHVHRNLPTCPAILCALGNSRNTQVLPGDPPSSHESHASLPLPPFPLAIALRFDLESVTRILWAQLQPFLEPALLWGAQTDRKHGAAFCGDICCRRRPFALRHNHFAPGKDW